MFMNENLNNYYYPMGNKSVVLELEKKYLGFDDFYQRAIVNPDMVRLIDLLRVKRPTWKFKSEERVYLDNQKLFSFDVYDGDEKLGRIWLEKHWRTGDTRYYYNNHRRQESQKRGHGGFSTKVKVAAAKVLEEFYARSLQELIDVAARDVRTFTHGLYSNANYEYMTAKRKVMDALADYIVRHWDELRVHAAGASDVPLDKLSVKAEEFGTVISAINDKTGVVLAEEGNGFIYWRGSETPMRVTLNDLSEPQRAKVGMLKLLTEDAVVPGIGARRGKTFFILD